MKRADLSTCAVLAAIRNYGILAIDRLLERYPEKVILAAFKRDAAYLDYGVSERRPWLTLEGERRLRECGDADAAR